MPEPAHPGALAARSASPAGRRAGGRRRQRVIAYPEIGQGRSWLPLLSGLVFCHDGPPAGRYRPCFRSSATGWRLTHGSLWLLERLRIVPRGTTHVSSILNLAGAAFAEAGRLGIFSPMYFIPDRKPE